LQGVGRKKEKLVNCEVFPEPNRRHNMQQNPDQHDLEVREVSLSAAKGYRCKLESFFSVISYNFCSIFA